MPSSAVIIKDSPKRKSEVVDLGSPEKRKPEVVDLGSPEKKIEQRAAGCSRRFAEVWPQYVPSPEKRIKTSPTTPRFSDSIEKSLADIDKIGSQNQVATSPGTTGTASSGSHPLKSFFTERDFSPQSRDVISQIRVASNSFTIVRSQFEIFGSFKYAAIKHFCDIDCVERVAIHGSSLEEAARIAASLLKEAARRLESSSSAFFVELKAGIDHQHAEKYAEITTGPSQNGSNWERQVRDALGREDVEHRHIALRRLHYNLRRIRWNSNDLRDPAPVKELDVYGRIDLVDAILNSDRIMIVALVFLEDDVLMEASNMVMLEWVPDGKMENTKAISCLCLQWPTDRLASLMDDARNYIYLGFLVKAAKRMWSVLLTIASTNDSCVSEDARERATYFLQSLLPFFKAESEAAALAKLVKNIDVVLKASKLSSSHVALEVCLPKAVDCIVKNLQDLLDNLPSSLLRPDEAFFHSMLTDGPNLQAYIERLTTTAKPKLEALATRLAARFFDDTFGSVHNCEQSINEILSTIPTHAQTRRAGQTIPVPLTITQASAAARGLTMLYLKNRK